MKNMDSLCNFTRNDLKQIVYPSDSKLILIAETYLSSPYNHPEYEALAVKARNWVVKNPEKVQFPEKYRLNPHRVLDESETPKPLMRKAFRDLYFHAVPINYLVYFIEWTYQGNEISGGILGRYHLTKNVKSSAPAILIYLHGVLSSSKSGSPKTKTLAEIPSDFIVYRGSRVLDFNREDHVASDEHMRLNLICRIEKLLRHLNKTLGKNLTDTPDSQLTAPGGLRYRNTKVAHQWQKKFINRFNDRMTAVHDYRNHACKASLDALIKNQNGSLGPELPDYVMKLIKTLIKNSGEENSPIKMLMDECHTYDHNVIADVLRYRLMLRPGRRVNTSANIHIQRAIAEHPDISRYLEPLEFSGTVIIPMVDYLDAIAGSGKSTLLEMMSRVINLMGIDCKIYFITASKTLMAAIMETYNKDGMKPLAKNIVFVEPKDMEKVFSTASNSSVAFFDEFGATLNKDPIPYDLKLFEKRFALTVLSGATMASQASIRNYIGDRPLYRIEPDLIFHTFTVVERITGATCSPFISASRRGGRPLNMTSMLQKYVDRACIEAFRASKTASLPEQMMSSAIQAIKAPHEKYIHRKFGRYRERDFTGDHISQWYQRIAEDYAGISSTIIVFTDDPVGDAFGIDSYITNGSYDPTAIMSYKNTLENRRQLDAEALEISLAVAKETLISPSARAADKQKADRLLKGAKKNAGTRTSENSICTHVHIIMSGDGDHFKKRILIADAASAFGLNVKDLERVYIMPSFGNTQPLDTIHQAIARAGRLERSSTARAIVGFGLEARLAIELCGSDNVLMELWGAVSSLPDDATILEAIARIKNTNATHMFNIIYLCRALYHERQCTEEVVPGKFDRNIAKIPEIVREHPNRRALVDMFTSIDAQDAVEYAVDDQDSIGTTKSIMFRKFQQGLAINDPINSQSIDHLILKPSVARRFNWKAATIGDIRKEVAYIANTNTEVIFFKATKRLEAFTTPAINLDIRVDATL